ncbi:Plant transposon protein [Fragilaria crotonensis]|nr:Plant transposon protein [Fragilaria crotonensis]
MLNAHSPRLAGVENADKKFLTSCALHNWLLDVDGLSAEPWDGGVATSTTAGGQNDDVPGGWDGEMGQYDEEDYGVFPSAIRNLNNPVAMRSYDLSGMGPGSDAILTDDEELGNYAEESAAVGNDNISSCSDHGVDNQVELVRKLSLAEFRKRL